MKRSKVAMADVAEIRFSTARCVVGLWRSGLYGVGFGMQMGLMAGAAVGTIVPILGNLVGGVIGAIVGAVVGLPAGILGAALGGRQGWRVAGAASMLAVGLSVLWIIGCAESRSPMPSLPMWVGLVLAGCVQVGFWSGDCAFHRLETSDGFYDRWRQLLHDYELDTPVDTSCSLLLALLPVALVYGSTLLSCLAR